MESTRQQKVSKLIQKEMSDVLLRNCPHLSKGKMITITSVRVSPDLAQAKIYMSIFPGDKTKEVILAFNEETKTLRVELGRKVKNQLRIVPDISFFVDDSLDYLDNINRLLKK